MSLPIITHPCYSFDFSAQHRFPMEKYRLLHEHLQAKGIARPVNTFRPGRCKHEVLALAHCEDYLQRLYTNTLDPKEERRLGLPWSEALLQNTLVAPGGTLLAAHYALQHGLACHLAGGTHHGHFDYGSGFCALNDLAIAAKALLAYGQVKSLLIFDLDVHQGDGTASILADEPRAFTCSVHCGKNFPARKATSDMDVEVDKGCEDAVYLSLVEASLHEAIARSQPELIFYDAGVDIYSHDPLGLLNISLEGIRQRDRLVLETCREYNIPVATVIGGGYDDDRHALVARHAIAVEEAAKVFQRC